MTHDLHAGPDWKFLEKRAPGIRAAWKRDVALPEIDFTIGVTGDRKAGTYRAVACSRAWSKLPEGDRKYFVFDLTTRTWSAP